MDSEQRIEEIVKNIGSLFGISLVPFKAGISKDQSTGAKSIKWTDVHLSILSQNNSLLGSPYFYTKNQLVHFTDFEALNSIIRSKSIRLHNLNNLDDPREFSFAGDLFSLTTVEKRDVMDNFFVMAFCDPEILENREIAREFNLWRLYGKNGKGAAIIFSIRNQPSEWFEFHISKIIYGAKNRKNFKTLYNLVQELKEDFSLSVDVNKLCTFHKSRIYNIEREVRIMWDRREIRAGRKNRVIHHGEKQVFPIIKEMKRKPKVQFLELPIYYPNLAFQGQEIPLLKIEEIVIGYKHMYDHARKDKLLSLSKSLLGYAPKVSYSRLVKPYWGNNMP